MWMHRPRQNEPSTHRRLQKIAVDREVPVERCSAQPDPQGEVKGECVRLKAHTYAIDEQPKNTTSSTAVG